MSTVLTAGHSFADLEGVRAVLAQAGAGAGLVVWSEALAAGPLQQQLAEGASLVLAYVAPAVSVGRALKAAGEGPAPAVADLLADWRAAGEAMLALAVRHPDQCLLVNAEAALAAPTRLLEQAQQALGLAMDPAALSGAVASTGPLSPLETLLAGALVAADHEAASLFIELESCAHLGQDTSASAAQLAQEAWAEFQGQFAAQAHAASDTHLAQLASNAEALAQASREHAALEERLASLTRDRDQQVNLAISVAEALEGKEVALARQTALAQHLQREGESLLMQLHEAHLEAEEFFKQADSLRTELGSAKAETHAARAEVAALQAELASAQSTLANVQQGAAAQKVQLLVHAGALQQAQDKLAKLEAEHADTTTRLSSLQADTEGHRQVRQERDRSRVQLMQLNADVARLQESGQRDAALLAQAEAARRLLQSFWHAQQPDEVRIDLNHDISGANWYPPEGDGRWTGPERQSTLVLPALKPGRYSLQMTLVGAMNPQIAAGLRVELNGRPLDLTFNRTKHPRVGTVSFEAPPAGDGAWVLSLNVPAVESPAERGSPDQRQLGVRVADIKFTAPLKV